MHRCLAVLLLALPGTPAAAQRTPFAQFRDSLAHVTDTISLRRMAVAPERDAGALVAAGLAGLRLFDLTGSDADNERARRAFREVTESDPGNVWAWYGLGLSWALEAGTRGTPTIVIGQAFAEALGTDATSRALRALRRALEIDPSFWPAAEALVPLAITKRNREALERAREALATIRDSGESTPAAWMALARAETALGNGLAAADAARRAAGLATDAGILPDAQYRLAIALFLSGDDVEGARAWFTAVDGLTPEVADAVFDDLRTIADDHETERWQGSDLEARREWLREFWDVRAALAGLTVAERIGSHYRRLHEARDRFPRRRKWGAPPGNALLLERPDLPFDDRGIIYIRHGEPITVIRTSQASTPPSESWVYRNPEGGFRVLHFANYASATRAAEAIGNPAAISGGMGDSYNEYVLVYQLPCDAEWAGARAAWDKRLALLRCNEFDIRSISAEVRRDAWTALRTDSDQPKFARDIMLVFDVYTFRGRNGTTDVTTALAVPASELDSASTQTLQLSVIVADTMFGRVTRTDTIVRFDGRGRPRAGNETARFHATLRVPPGLAQAHRVILRSADSTFGGIAGRALDVPDYTGSRLVLSDIVIAATDTTSVPAFHRGDATLPLMPGAAFRAGDFQVFYEIYNLTPDAEYETELTVERAGRGLKRLFNRVLGRTTVVRLRFRDRTAPGEDALSALRRVAASLQPGDYRLRIRILDRTNGQTAERTRSFSIRND